MERKRTRPIIRVFVSSTFSDLKLERDALQRWVFPKLEQLCLRDGFQFQAIDLRWGISTEAGLDHRTMRICFEELRRSQKVSPEPNFLILLGNRYGWRPLPEEISVDEYRRLEQAAGQIEVASQQPSPVEVLSRWYRLDENSLTPVYIFQPRHKPVDGDSDRRDYTTVKAWRNVEQVLWQIVNQAFPAHGLKDRFGTPHSGDQPLPSIVRFQASATEQEIWSGALNVSNASEHVLAIFREIDLAQNALDVETLRDFFDVVDGQIDPLSKTAQHELKRAIQDRLGDCAVVLKPDAKLEIRKDQSGRQSASVSTDHIDELCREVETRLATVIERQIKEYWRAAQSSGTVSSEQASEQRTARELEIERDEHLRFGEERGSKRFFVGRDEQDGPLERILDYVKNDSSLPLVIHGDSGCGKTALLARAFQEIPAKKKAIIRFIGVTPHSSDLGSLLRSLCQELRGQHAIAEAISSDVRELMQEFRKHLEAATAEQPVILLLDALDQLPEADNGRQLFWIPFGPLPSHVKIAVSCLSGCDENDPVGQPYVALQRRKLPAENMLNLDALSLDDAKTLLFDRWLRNADRTVNEAQRRLIEERLEPGTQDDAERRQPLYLKLLFEEATQWRSWDEPQRPGDTVAALLEQLVTRLSLATNHGHLIVERALGYIAAARRGLSETEILEVLFGDLEYKAAIEQESKDNRHVLPTEPGRIPIAIWSRLRSDLAPYLVERSVPGGNVLTLYHRQVAEWVKDKFVNKAGHWNPRERLGEYFKGQDYFLESDGDERDRTGQLVPEIRVANGRKVDELPWQLRQVANPFGIDDQESMSWDALADLLCTLNFAEAKCEAGLCFDLLADYFIPSHCARYTSVERIRNAIEHSLTTIVERPQLTLQSLHNVLRWIEHGDAQLDTELRSAHDRLMSRSPWLSAESSPPDTTQQRFRSVPFGIKTTIQSETASNEVFAIAEPNGTVELRNTSTGQLLQTRFMPVRNLAGIALSNDGSHLACIDQLGRVFVDESGATFQGRPGETRLAVHSDGAGVFVVVATPDDQLVAWNPETGDTEVIILNVPLPLSVLEISRNAETILVATGDQDHFLAVVSRHSDTWNVRLVLENANAITHGTISQDGSLALLASEDRCLRSYTGSGEFVAEMPYEHSQGTIIHGRPCGCILGEGAATGFAFFATGKGQIGAWNWEQGTLDRLPDFSAQHVAAPQMIRLEFDSSSDKLRLRFADHFRLLSRELSGQDHGTQAPITDCCFGVPGELVTASQTDASVRWMSRQGLRQIKLCVLDQHQTHHPSRLCANQLLQQVVVGTQQGSVHRYPLRSSDIGSFKPFGCFQGAVESLLCTPEGTVIAGNSLGEVKRLDFERSWNAFLRGSSSGTRRQICLLPSPGSGYCLSVYHAVNSPDITLAILQAPDKEQTVMGASVGIEVVALSSDRHRLALAGHYVEVLEKQKGIVAWLRGARNWKTVCRRKTAVTHASFLLDGSFLAVVTSQDPWLEVWEVSPAMPTVAAVRLTSPVSCMTTQDEWLAVGFDSGDLRTFLFPTTQR